MVFVNAYTVCKYIDILKFLACITCGFTFCFACLLYLLIIIFFLYLGNRKQFLFYCQTFRSHWKWTDLNELLQHWLTVQHKREVRIKRGYWRVRRLWNESAEFLNAVINVVSSPSLNCTNTQTHTLNRWQTAQITVWDKQKCNDWAVIVRQILWASNNIKTHSGYGCLSSASLL